MNTEINTDMHVSVLLHETIDGLKLRDGEIFVDGTINGGGHSEAAAREAQGLTVVGFDMDAEALKRAEKRLAGLCDLKLVNASFRKMDESLRELGITTVDKILLDIGLSSDQFETSGRGFSFQKDEPLLMTFKSKPGKDDLTARDILNHWDAENIEAVIDGYGEERFARRIAQAIVAAREVKPIETTFQLVEVIKSATPKSYHFRKIHPATKTFQALRITVNDEIESLKEGLRRGFEILNRGGRMAVISFHSLEDREVKQFFRKQNDEGKGKLITKKPITATEQETAENPRSRSAKLRIIEKT